MILNYKFGCFPPAGWDEDCEREIRLQDDLWNRLVRIETAYRDRVELVLRQEADYSAAVERVAVITSELESVVAERAAQRKAARAKIATPALDEQIANLSARRREGWSVVKPLRTRAFRDHRDELKTLADRRYSDFTVARQESGLWWSNYNAVIGSFDATLRRIQPWQMPRPIEGARQSGRLTVQIQRGVPAPAFMAGARREAGIELEEGQWIRRGYSNWQPRRATLTATVRSEGYATRKTASWPMIMHRPLPPDSMVKILTITRRHPVPTARAWKWECIVTVEIPTPDSAPERLVAGIDLGWRKVEAGVRVATIADTAGGIEHVVLPAAMLDRRARIATLQGTLAREAIEADADKTDQPDWRRLQAEINRWNRRRLDMYRCAAAALVARCSLIGLDGTGIASMAQDRKLPPETRRMRTWVAPAELAAAIRDAARRTGVRLREVEGASTIVCHHCGHRNAVSEADRLNLIWRCHGCGALWDQDENAACNCLATALDAQASESVGVKGTTERRKPPRLVRKKDRPKTDPQPPISK